MKLKVAVLGLMISGSTMLSGCSVLSIGDEEFSCPGRENGVLCKGPREVYEMTNNRTEIVMGKDAESADKDAQNYTLEGSVEDHAWLLANFDRIEADAIDDPDDDTITLYKAAVKAKMRAVSLNQHSVITPQTLYKPRSNNRQHPESYDQASVVEKKSISTLSGSIANQGEHGQLSLFSTAPHDIAPEPLALLKPAEVMRILIAPYKDDSNALNMPGYVYIDLQPRSWIVGEQATTTPQRIIPLDIRHKSQQQMAEEENRRKGVTGLGVGQLPQMPNMGKQNTFSATKADSEK